MSTPKKTLKKKETPKKGILTRIADMVRYQQTIFYIWHTLLSVFSFLRGLAVVSFFARYWIILLILGILAAVIITGVLWTVAGAMIWIPALTVGAMATALLLRNIFNRQTTDADADSGRYDEMWEGLDDKTKVLYTIVQLLGYFIGACIVAASMALRS